VSTAKISATTSQIKSSNTLSAMDAILGQGADKPIANTPKMAGGGYKADFVIIICLLAGISVCDSVIYLCMQVFGIDNYAIELSCPESLRVQVRVVADHPFKRPNSFSLTMLSCVESSTVFLLSQ